MFDEIQTKSQDLIDKLKTSDNRRDLIDKYIATYNGRYKAPDIPQHLKWVNSEQISLADCKGKVVVLDFFTYCCINCMHILPALHLLEKECRDSVLVLGVHSGKFQNEKCELNILNAIRRYDITHPVVNDADYEAWSTYNIVCWPTLVIISPQGYILMTAVGESDVAVVMDFVKTTAEVLHDDLTTDKTIVPLTAPHIETDYRPGALSYPGKLHYCVERDTIFVSDTSNNRVLEVERWGEIINTWNKGFNTPQGLVTYQDTLYVCSTNDHTIKSVDLKSGIISTVCGTGIQGSDLEGGNKGSTQPISSPWDIEIVHLATIDNCAGDLLLIAMSGTHQIWAYALTDAKITFRGRIEEYKEGQCWCMAGSGVEGNRNNSYPLKATFAQPSGLSYDHSKNTLYIADSESSSIRSLELPSCAIKNVCGGGIDPTDLFSYGDVDGKGTSAKLQHPIGVAFHKSHLYICDSYNHKLKNVDVAKRVLVTIGTVDALQEPSGATIDPYSCDIYIADTNNSVIKRVNLSDKSITSLILTETLPINKKPIKLPELFGAPGLNKLSVHLIYSDGRHLNEQGDSSVTVKSCGEVELVIVGERKVEKLDLELGFEIEEDAKGRLTMQLKIFTCSDEGACFVTKRDLTIQISSVGTDTEHCRTVSFD